MSYRFETYGELRPWMEREWLLTNGTGSFAMSTALGCNTRRYHGLLVAAMLPPVGRVLALNRIGESVLVDAHHRDGQGVELSINCFPNSIHPRGDRLLRSFELSDVARFEFDCEGVKIVKEVLLVWGKPIVGVRYSIEPLNKKKVELKLQPFVSLRDFHSLLSKRDGMFEVSSSQTSCAIGANGQKLTLLIDSGKFIHHDDWWFNHVYPVETERGLDDREDLFSPGSFSCCATEPTQMTLWASMIPMQSPLHFDDERKRAEQSAKIPAMQTTAQNRLAKSAQQFLCERNLSGGKHGTTVLAGFPWFADWGRDTMISLPGLMLTTRRFDQAAQVLSVFAEHVSEGMIPNKFDDYTNEPSYNTVDASLWFIHACFEYKRVSRDVDLFKRELLPACQEIINGYRKGTRFNIRMDEVDGLISAGNTGTQLTWMDAKMGDIVFTPRHGKAVEINALWFNALKLLGENQLADKVQSIFAKQFWVSAFRGLADVINEHGRDIVIRPNQIFAVSLPYSPLSLDQQRTVVEVVRRELLTPVGLRTLGANEAGYQRKYTGNQFERDRAYHNGTIWPWLIGPFIHAYLKVNHFSDEARRQARAWLSPLVGSLETACIGSISEIYEAESPHRPVGACAQAWSVAEVLRLAVELEM